MSNVTAVADTWWHFMVSPTCPPTQGVHVRPGYLLLSWYWLDVGAGHWIGEAVIDFGAGIDGASLSFSNAHYYQALILTYTFDSMPPWREEWDTVFPQAVGANLEHATSLDAERHLAALLTGGLSFYVGYNFPLWALVLRNDGVVGVPGSVLPVDQINRGRSYLWRDCRPRHLLGGTAA